MLNKDSRSRFAVGRMPCDFGAASARPRNRPPTILICVAAYPSLACAGGCFAQRIGWGDRAHRKRAAHSRPAAGGGISYAGASRASICPPPLTPPRRFAGGGGQSCLVLAALHPQALAPA